MGEAIIELHELTDFAYERRMVELERREGYPKEKVSGTVEIEIQFSSRAEAAFTDEVEQSWMPRYSIMVDAVMAHKQRLIFALFRLAVGVEVDRLVPVVLNMALADEDAPQGVRAMLLFRTLADLEFKRATSLATLFRVNNAATKCVGVGMCLGHGFMLLLTIWLPLSSLSPSTPPPGCVYELCMRHNPKTAHSHNNIAVHVGLVAQNRCAVPGGGAGPGAACHPG